MKKITKARKYSSPKLRSLLDEVNPLEMEQTKVKMQIAARIEDLMKKKGWGKSQFADLIGKNPSEITKWFSGTQNFTVDVLTEIAFALGVEVANLFEHNLNGGTHSIKNVVDHTTPAKDVVMEGDPSKRTEGICYPTTEWTPKWGDDTLASDNGVCWRDGVYVAPNPDTQSDYPHIVMMKETGIVDSYKHIHPIPPKPKTLRDEVVDWVENVSLHCEDTIALLDIINRHEKGGSNG